MTQGDEDSDLGEAFAEMERLRQKIAQLQDRVRLLDELAHQDALLSVPNRRGFMRELDWLIDRVSRYDERAAMLFVDIDGLKQINDRYGHKAGDDALLQVTAALTRGVRKSDIVARLGGDEFGILLAHADEQIARDTAARLTNDIDSEKSFCDGHEVTLGVAIGFTMIASGDSADAVIARADKAMYLEKSAAA